jgi:iturin family lipopeptide synthetase A
MRDHHLTIQPTNICPEDRVVLLSSVSLVAMGLINGTLHAGASLFPFNVREEGTGPLAAWLQEQQITIYHSGSPLFRTFMEGLNDSDVFPSVRVVRLGSQTAFRSDFEHYKKHFSPACILLNGLASTEVVRSHLFYVDRDTQILGSTIPVGYPVDGPIESIVVETDTSSRLQHPRHRNSEALISLIAKKETAHDQR